MIKPFAEEGTFAIQGKKFTSGGAWLGQRIDTGLHEGVFYAYPKESKVGNWDGSIKVPAKFGREWMGNMGDIRQHVTFKWEGVQFSGTYYKSAGDIVRAKEMKGGR